MMTDNETHRLMEREFPDYSRGQREVLAELYQELKAQGAPERWEREAAAEETERPVYTLARKKSRKPSALMTCRQPPRGNVPAGTGQDHFDPVRYFGDDPYFLAADRALQRINRLPHLHEALGWLGRRFPEFRGRLRDWWPEQLSDAATQRVPVARLHCMLEAWVELHEEVCGLYAFFVRMERGTRN